MLIILFKKISKISGYRLIISLLLLFSFGVNAKVFTVGSKRFTESYILSALIAKTIQSQAHIEVIDKQGLGSTGIVFSALKNGDIDVYPEYWGTLTQEILHVSDQTSIEEVNEILNSMGLKADVFLGFDNSYALAMSREKAKLLNIKSIADLRDKTNLRLGLSLEFLSRKDGWPGLSKAYGLSNLKPIGIEHGLVYEALANQKIDVVDAYTTDPRIISGNLVLLEDDIRFFSSYQAFLIYRLDSISINNDVLIAMQTLQNKITNSEMQSLNARVELNHEDIKSVADSYYTDVFTRGGIKNQNISEHSSDLTLFLNFLGSSDFYRLTLQQSELVFLSLFIAIFLGIPIGVYVYYVPSIGQPFLYGLSLLQTIPSLALLSFLIFAVNSIGFLPAFIALFLYGMLPIIEATQAGLRSVDKSVIEASQALGAGFWTQLWNIELPLSRSTLFAGFQLAAVWTTGTATIAAFVGAGGYGERIAQGLSTNNTEMMLEGAIPSAIFALLLRKFISVVERLK